MGVTDRKLNPLQVTANGTFTINILCQARHADCRGVLSRLLNRAGTAFAPLPLPSPVAREQAMPDAADQLRDGQGRKGRPLARRR